MFKNSMIGAMYNEARKNLKAEIEEVSQQYFIEKKKLEKATEIVVTYNKSGYLILETQEDFTIDLIKKNLEMLAQKFETLGTRYTNLEYNYRDLAE